MRFVLIRNLGTSLMMVWLHCEGIFDHCTRTVTNLGSVDDCESIYLTAAPELRTTWGQLADSACMICCLTWPAAWTLSGRSIWRYWPIASLFQSPTNIMISLLTPICAIYVAPPLRRLWVEYAVGPLPMAMTMFFIWCWYWGYVSGTYPLLD